MAYNVGHTGFDAAEIDALLAEPASKGLTDPDEVPEPPGRAPCPALSPVTYRRRAPTVGRPANPDSDPRGEIGHRTSRSNSRGLKTGHRASFRNSRKRPFLAQPH